jgi:hypothetical protein
VKTRIQFTPETTLAILCAASWFILWLLIFQPASIPPHIPFAGPEFIRLIADDETLNKLKAPTLFALPSPEGFSGEFLETRIDLPLTLEKPSDPARYLPRQNLPVPAINPALLMGKTAFLQSPLPIPGDMPPAITPPPTATQLFLSPELSRRAEGPLSLTIKKPGFPDTLRANLVIRADGTVESAFFEQPVTNPALAGAIRNLQFKPGKQKTEGWIDVRFPTEGN